MTDATSAASAATPASGSTLSTSGTTLTPTSDGLGENQFLELMMDQLKNQNPLSPADPTQYMSELASFSSLEQQMQIASSASTSATQQSSTTAINLLGKTVTYTLDGATQTGTVSKVDFATSGPTLTVGSATGVPLTAVSEAS